MFSRGIKVGDPEQVRRAHPTRLSSWQRGVIAYINGTIASLLVLLQRVQTNTNLLLQRDQHVRSREMIVAAMKKLTMGMMMPYMAS